MPNDNTESSIKVAIDSLDIAINAHEVDARTSQKRALYGIMFLAVGFMKIRHEYHLLK